MANRVPAPLQAASQHAVEKPTDGRIVDAIVDPDLKTIDRDCFLWSAKPLSDRLGHRPIFADDHKSVSRRLEIIQVSREEAVRVAAMNERIAAGIDGCYLHLLAAQVAQRPGLPVAGKSIPASLFARQPI